jgi:hypothetical protein
MVQPRMEIDPLTGQPLALSTPPPAPGTTNYSVPGTPVAPTGPTGPGADGLAPATGWAASQGFTPSMLQSLYSNPWYALPKVFGENMQLSSPGYQALRDIGADPLALFLMTQGAGSTIPEGGQGASDFANFLNTLYSSMGTSGGQGLDFRELAGNIFGQDVSDKANTALGLTLNAGDMGQQIRTFFNMIRDAASSSMNPLAASGYQAAIARAGDRYGSEMLTRDAGNTPHIIEWMRQNMPGLVVT